MRRDQSWVAWEKSIPDRKIIMCEHLGIKDTEYLKGEMKATASGVY